MKRILLVMMAVSLAFACGTRKKSMTDGMTEVTGPFSAKKYQSDRRYFRATGSGESMNAETSKNMALLQAKQRLASSVQTQIKSVQEAYASDRKAEGGAEFEERFQNLTREVLNQIIVETSTIGEKTFKKTDGNYVTYIALEGRKRTTYKKLKEIARQRTSLSDKDKEYIDKMIDKAIEETGDTGD